MYLELLMRDAIVTAQQREDIRQQTPARVQVGVQTVDKSILSLDTNLQQNTGGLDLRNIVFLNQTLRLLFFHCSFSVATIRERHLFRWEARIPTMTEIGTCG